MPDPSTKAENDKSSVGKVIPTGDSVQKWFSDFFDLRSGSDRVEAVRSISNGKQMRGSNAWMLVCSILIASLGLNLNSGAVIIGAMLISPLMNPILGVGLGVGTNDLPMLWQSLKNFGVSIIIALTTSVVYFLLTPIETFTPEMQSRVEPTILDALVAVFGGLAGIISITREDKTNAIPGVAIATALMPPLCVAGYGLSLAVTDPSQSLTVFWRSFYLFFINSFFIAVTAYAIIRLLRFPYRKYLNKQEARKSVFIVLVVSILIIIPSMYILNDVLHKQQEEEAARKFTEHYFPSSLSSYQLSRGKNQVPLIIYPIKSRFMSADSIDFYNAILREPPYNLKNGRIVTDTSLINESLMSRKAMSSYGDRLADLELRQQAIAKEVAEQRIVPTPFSDTLAFSRLQQQLRVAFPQIETFALSIARVGQGTTPYGGDYPLAVIQVNRPGVRPEVEEAMAEKIKLEQFLKLALERDSVIVVVQER